MLSTLTEERRLDYTMSVSAHPVYNREESETLLINLINFKQN